MNFIPVCEPTLEGNELKYVSEAVSTGWISSAGGFITKFEDEFAKFCGTKHAVSCSNGTKAIHLALESLRIGPGDEVIIPTFTMAATANAVIYTGAKPVLVDAELDTWNMDLNQIEGKINSKTKAIMVVHTYGHPCDMDKVREIANKHNLFVIEDAAEAHGAEYKGKKAGNLSDIACFSFYANKILTTGEGGMVVTNNLELAERCKSLRNHFFGTGENRFKHLELGFNYRLTNMQAAVGVAQLEQAQELVDSRRHNAYLYNYLLQNVPGVKLPPETCDVKNVYWMYGIMINEEFGMSMPELREKLQQKGIGTRTFFIGMHKQPAYQKEDQRFPDCSGNFPVADELEKKGLYLPSASHLTLEQIHYITDTLKEIKNAKNSERSSSFI
jgi:perosamine synthetase